MSILCDVGNFGGLGVEPHILQYESKIWATADLLRGSGIKESEWPLL